MRSVSPITKRIFTDFILLSHTKLVFASPGDFMITDLYGDCYSLKFIARYEFI